jgi:LacI family transcriptional regulator
MRATLKQIAEMSGVHRSTVDKVLHNREGVSIEVRGRVQKIIDELDYEPNAIGKALARQKNPLVIAILLLKVNAVEEIKAGIELAYGELKSFGIKLEYYINNEHDYSEQLATIQLLAKKNIAGLVISPIRHAAIIKAINDLVDLGIPVVTINTDIPESKRMCYIGQDSVRAGRVAGELMGEILGSRGKVAVINGSEHMLCNVERQKGFEKVLAESFPNIQIVETIETHEQALEAFQKTLALIKKNKDLDGIFITCGNVSEVGRAVRLMNKDKKIKIISFDLYAEIIELVKSEVINFTIGQNLPAQGYRSLKVIFEKLFYNQTPESSFVRTAIDLRLKENIDLN